MLFGLLFGFQCVDFFSSSFFFSSFFFFFFLPHVFPASSDSPPPPRASTPPSYACAGALRLVPPSNVQQTDTLQLDAPLAGFRPAAFGGGPAGGLGAVNESTILDDSALVRPLP